MNNAGVNQIQQNYPDSIINNEVGYNIFYPKAEGIYLLFKSKNSK